MNIRRFLPTIALCALVFAGFSSCQQAAPANNTNSSTTTSTNNNIVFIKLDSITVQYTALKTKLENLEGRLAEAESTHGQRVAAFQKDLQSLQRRANSGQMSPKQIGQEQERLAGREQTLMQETERIRQEFQLEQLTLMSAFEKNLKKVLDDVQAEFKYDYILNYSAATGVLMANDAHDITPEITQRLNTMTLDMEAPATEAAASEE